RRLPQVAQDNLAQVLTVAAVQQQGAASMSPVTPAEGDTEGGLVHAGDDEVEREGIALPTHPVEVVVVGDCLPAGLVGQVDAVDEDDGLVQAHRAGREVLPADVGFRHGVAVHHGDIEPVSAERGQLHVQFGQPDQHVRPGAAGTDQQYPD